MQQWKPWLVGVGMISVLSLTETSVAGIRGGRGGRFKEPRSFHRVATLPNYLNNGDAAEETVSEIVATTHDGRTLVYTDSPLHEIGFADISQPQEPVGTGKLEVGGEPTSVVVLDDGRALVGVNTSESFVTPSGHLAVVDIQSRGIVAEIPLGGQPDSVAVSPDGTFVAIAVENERDEDVEVDRVEGGLPQGPGGFLAVIDLTSEEPSGWVPTVVDLSGLAGYGGTDAEPEFVDINADNQAVVTLQENNHVVVVDLSTGRVGSHFDAGRVDLHGVDAQDDGVISLGESLLGVPREPDAVTWLPGPRGRQYIATANEGDLFGGSRGFSIFTERGAVVYDSGTELEELAVRHGHYPEDRSDKKGTEPEAIVYGRFGKTDYLFVGSERGSFVAVYELVRGQPVFSQLLPAPLGPEGVLPIPSRNLLVVSGEADEPSFGVRSSIMIYELSRGEPSYPEIVSADDREGKPIAWSALSGMTAVPGSRSQLLGVWDSYYAESRIFHIDASQAPAVIRAATTLTGGSGDYDAEGIAVAPDGSLWIASEGNASGSRKNRLLHVEHASGRVLEEVYLPEEIEACRAASTNRTSLGAGFEGVAVVPNWRGYELLVAQQRGWDYTTPECEDLDDDPEGLDSGEPPQTRIWTYDPGSRSWGYSSYELEPIPERASWVGLSEISAVPLGYVVIERDNRTGDFAELKTLTYFSRWDQLGGVGRDEKRIFDLMPALLSTRGWISDKAEGVAITHNGSLFLVTDNDGVEDWNGETQFVSLGKFWKLFWQ